MDEAFEATEVLQIGVLSKLREGLAVAQTETVLMINAPMISRADLAGRPPAFKLC